MRALLVGCALAFALPCFAEGGPVRTGKMSAMDGAGAMPAGTCVTVRSPDGTKTGTVCADPSNTNVNAVSLGPVMLQVSDNNFNVVFRTPTDGLLNVNSNGMGLNSIVTGTFWLGYLKADYNWARGTATTGIDIGNGRRSNVSGILEVDTWTWTSGFGREMRIHPAYSPASGTGQFSPMEINPAYTGTSSGVSPALIIDPSGCTTGGTCPLIDAGTTTTDYATGFTRKFRVENDGTVFNAPNQLSSVASGTGITTVASGVFNGALLKITIDRTAWSAAALTQDINIGTIPARAKIKSIYSDTTALFTGPAGTLTLSVGTTAGGTQLLLGHDVKTCSLGTTCVKGILDADLGASITRAAAIQGGFLPSWTATTTISARLVSSSGNLSTLTTGSTTYYVQVEFN